MPINLCCDVCQAFIKRVSTHDAQRMLKNPEPSICGHCERTRSQFRKQCEKVLNQVKKDSERMKVGMESKFLEVMKEAIEESLKASEKVNEPIDDIEPPEKPSEAQLQ
jgi:hypothetical protein